VVKLVAQWFNSQLSHTKDLKIGDLSTQLGTQLESEIEESWVKIDIYLYTIVVYFSLVQKIGFFCNYILICILRFAQRCATIMIYAKKTKWKR